MKTLTRAQYIAALQALGLDPHATSQVVIVGPVVNVRTVVTDETGNAEVEYGQFRYVDETYQVIDTPPEDA